MLRRVITGSLLLVAACVLSLTIIAWTALQKSLPQLDGEVNVAGISLPVSIERDVAGIPVITAANRRDLAYATGFVHAQDRFFQMDLTRRKSAGELSELFGEIALGVDKRVRLHRFRARAEQAIRELSPSESAVLNGYVDGVNAGLGQLGARPFEYFLLRETPRPWTATDSILVGYAMFLELNDERAARDVRRGLVQQVLPDQVFDWLYPQGTDWDAPIMGEARALAPLPAASEFSIREDPVSEARLPANAREMLPGSNNWAVAGSLTKTGRAMVANDMHLGITVPNVFYRARLRMDGAKPLDLNGVTLPGVPVIVAGSNTYIAWGNTNSYGDWSDAVIVKPGQRADTYLTPLGERPIQTFKETISVKGGNDYELAVRETIWGPVLDDNEDPDRMLAVSWIAHFPEAINLAQLKLETVSDAAEALRVAATFGMPPQNFVVGDAAGNIGWTIAGKIPRRADYDAFLPADWSEASGWLGWLPADEYPQILNPASGRIWTANARVADADLLALIGDGGYDLGARAKQIRDRLFAQDEFTEADMLDVQLDDRAVFLARWRELILATMTDAYVDGNAERLEYRKLVEDWVPRASPASVGYRLVRGFRFEVRNRVFDMLTQRVRARFGSDIELRISNQFEAPLWSLLRARPQHLLAASYGSWDELLLQSIDANIEYYTSNFSGGLKERTWGERNTAAVRHPLSRSIPMLSDWLDMPAEPLYGDANLPRAQGPSFGASERFGVSPGDEENGYLHMPSGQSGHPLSEFYRRGHDDWVHGRFSAYLPGEAMHSVTLVPAD